MAYSSEKQRVVAYAYLSRTRTTIMFDWGKVKHLPYDKLPFLKLIVGSHLDYQAFNGIYNHVVFKYNKGAFMSSKKAIKKYFIDHVPFAEDLNPEPSTEIILGEKAES